MQKRLTALMALLILGVLTAPFVRAQVTDVTVREIQSLSPDAINALNAGGAALTEQDIVDNIFNELEGDTVRFAAVVLSDPTRSGLSTPSSGLPSRVHVFVRDTSAATLGPEGMGIQIVDASWQENGLLNLLVGDVIEIVARVSPFGNGMQVAPVTISLLGSYADLGLPPSILDPVTVTTADLAKEIGGDGQLQANWDNLGTIRNQYVRLENAVVYRRQVGLPDRWEWSVSTDNGATRVHIRDMSLSYRNDRFDTYNDPPFTLPDDEFTPPPPGAGINLEGFIMMYDFDGFEDFTPDEAAIFVTPFERSDLEITITPPIVTNVSEPQTVVGTEESTTITAEVTADPSRELTSVVLKYFTSSNATEMEVAGTNTSGNTWEFSIPPAADEDFVTYYILATDNVGAESQRIDYSYRTLTNGITKISHVQETADGGPGDSPFDGLTLPMNITATVVSQPDSSGFYAIQDDDGLAPWSGVLLRDGDTNVQTLKQGDVVNITEAEIDEAFGVTQLRNITMTVTGAAMPQGYKAVPTSALVDPKVAEQHEGMRVRFENVTIISDDEGFGEWSFSSDGTATNSVLADDASDAFGSSYATNTFEAGDNVAFIQGIWWFSFGDYKLVPESSLDIGGINVANEEFEVPGEFALRQNYPNPFNPSTTIQYDVPAASRVSIRVYDMLGREVATLVDGDVAAGIHTVSFDARNLASGVYVYRLETAGKVMNRSMMLLK